MHMARTIGQWREYLDGPVAKARFAMLYGADATRQPARYLALAERFCGGDTEKRFDFFSAPGRSEIGGNHTDHQHGRVVAAAVTLDVIACVAPNNLRSVRIRSDGFIPIGTDLDDMQPHAEEVNTSASIVRGVAAKLSKEGFSVSGFDAAVCSDVPLGAGLSSSAAFGILIGAVLSGLFNGGSVTPATLALSAKFAENVYFGKPSGLMDQLACATGGFAAMDFLTPAEPIVRRIESPLSQLGLAVCIVDGKGSHADLTDAYAAIPHEMRLVAEYFGKDVLREVDEKAFYSALPALRRHMPDRAILRAMHFFDEDRRAAALADALAAADAQRILNLIRASGRSSALLLENVWPVCSDERSLALALAVSERVLGNDGACRVHGGGFAGTMQAWMPADRISEYRKQMERIFGEGCCYLLSIRPEGAAKL